MSIKVNKTMLIDDSDIDLFIQRRFLEVSDFSHELISYKSAAEALAHLSNNNGEAPPDIIFLDLNMPETDGFAFLKTFTSLPDKIRNQTKVVVLTSSNSNTDRQMAFENRNVISFITKPLKQSDIEELKRLMKSQSQNG